MRQTSNTPMSNHVALTDDERKEVATFWGDYFRSSGEGRQATAFQLDAINDPDVRDAFLFWQLGADPTDYNPGFNRREKALALAESFGANPTGDQSVRALTRLMRNNNEQGVEIEDLDTGSVWTLAHIMWLLLGGAWQLAVDEATLLAELVIRYKQVLPEDTYPHDDPLSGLGFAAAMLGMTVSTAGGDEALRLSSQMYGLDENHENTRWARENYAQFRTERLKNDAA